MRPWDQSSDRRQWNRSLKPLATLASLHDPSHPPFVQGMRHLFNQRRLGVLVCLPAVCRDFHADDTIDKSDTRDWADEIADFRESQPTFRHCVEPAGAVADGSRWADGR
jgi:hypothetical protein